MRIELNAGGLVGMITIASFQADMEKTSSKIDDMISTFKAVKKSVYNINGGVGNLQEAVDSLQARINDEETKKESVGEIRKETNAFLKLAIEVDKQVSSIIDQNKEEFYELNPWLRPPKDDTLWDKFVNTVNEFVDSAVDFIKDVSETLVDWYENGGGKELLQILLKTIDIALCVANFIVDIALLTPPLTAIGIAKIVVDVVIVCSKVADNGLDIYNEANAYNKKQQALEAESNGDYDKAMQLRKEANALSEEDSWREKWWNDNETNFFDVLGLCMFGVSIVDVVEGAVTDFDALNFAFDAYEILGDYNTLRDSSFGNTIFMKTLLDVHAATTPIGIMADIQKTISDIEFIDEGIGIVGDIVGISSSIKSLAKAVSTAS